MDRSPPTITKMHNITEPSTSTKDPKRVEAGKRNVKKQWVPKKISKWTKIIAGTVAVCLAGCAIGLMISKRFICSSSHTERASVASVESESPEKTLEDNDDDDDDDDDLSSVLRRRRLS